MQKSLTKRTLQIFWKHSKKYPWHIAIVTTGVLARTAISTYIPILSRDLIDTLSKGASEANLKAALFIVILTAAAAAIRMLLWRLATFVNSFFQSRVMSDLTNTCYQYLQKHSATFFHSNFVGSLVTKVKRYERSFEQIADQVTFDLGQSLVDTAMILAVLLAQYRASGLLMLVWCVVFFIFSYFFSIFKLPYDIRRAAADTRTTAQLADSITNNSNIKLFASYERENKRFATVTDEQFRLRKLSWNLGTLGDLIQGTFMIAAEFVIMYLAVTAWSAGRLTIGDVTLLQAYLLRIFDKLWNAGKNIQRVYESIADANEMTQMLMTPHEVQDVPKAGLLRATKGEIVFANASFGYQLDTPVVHGFNLRIASGERLALIGPSGGGKSTVVRLLFRFHDLGHGKITIDGQDIARVTQDSLRAALSLVPQEPILFHRSLMENIRYAKPDATEGEVVRAATLAHAHEFISSFKQGYETFVGERGIKLSGGERQRVAIARAILKDAPILVLDEATSSLDSESEMYIQDALKQLMKDRTTIVIAHRLSTIMQMDRIVVVDHGKIVEEGKHQELLKAQQGVYQKLWEIQAGGFVSPA
jgi:ATP-binding cassette subfamily B protein